ncbi:hypothetical protein Tco_0644088 [Tanacetum coccineum]
MDPMISLGQKNTLVEYMILSGTNNRPPMLDKDLYDYWKSQMELYMQNREHGRMILESVEHGPLIWPTVEENDVIRTKKYAELSAAEKIQADCDMKATNIILQGLHADIYSLERECKLYDAFDKFTYIKGESLHTYYLRFTQLINDMNIYKMNMEQFQVNTKFLNSLPPEWSKFVTDVKLVKDLHTCNFDQLHAYLEQHELHANEVRFAVPVFSPGDDPIACLNKAMAFLTAVASSRFPTTNNQLRTSSNPRNQATIQDGRVTVQQVQGRQGQNYSGTTYKNNATSSRENTTTRDFEQSLVMDFIDNEISSDSNIIPYSQYLQETQQANEKANKEQNNESITAELERYKERVKTFEQRLNIDLSSREKMIDSQMDDMIREKLALKEQIDSLEQNLSKQIKEKESVLQTLAVFKNESKEKKNKYMETEIDLEKKIKELDNIICKVGQSAQIVHMLTKPQEFYDNTHKQALGYQNPLYLKKAQRIKPTLYDGVVISNTHVAMPMIDDEETLILEEGSRSKIFKKAKDPETVKQNISHKPIDYEKLNRLTEDFGKRFTPQQELLAEQAFWLCISNPSIEPSFTPPVIVDVPSELPKVSLVNTSLKKLKFHLTQFDSVVKKRTTPSALEEDLLNEITEVQTVFEQMETAVQQFSIDKQLMNSMSLNNDSVNMNLQKCDLCETCLNLDAELSKSKQAYSDLLKNHSQLEKYCISLELSMQLKQEVFQNDKLYVSQNDVEIPEYFVINDLKARLQDKDTTIYKLKDTIKSLEKNTKEKNVHHEKCDIEPINEEMKNKVAELKKYPLHTQVTSLVDEHLDIRLGETREEFMNLLSESFTARIKEQVKDQLPQILPQEVSNFAPPMIKKLFHETHDEVTLAKASSQP